MATLYTHQDANKRKTWLLMSMFFVVVIAIGYGVAWYFQSSILLYIAVFLAIAMNVYAYWSSDSLVVRLTGALPADEREYRELHRMVENLAITAGLPKPRVYIVEDDAPNAFATGRSPEHSLVAVTTGILRLLDKTELEGVLAHELSHIGNRDMLLSTVAVVLVGFVAIIADMFQRSLWFGGGEGRERNGALLIVALVVSILAPLAATLLQLAISRKREFLADASGALLTRYPEGLASALRKISAYGAPMQKQSTATAHLFITNPLGEGKKRRFSFAGIFSTHPPVEERIEALLQKKSVENV
jgi:heat shock protein HtpX